MSIVDPVATTSENTSDRDAGLDPRSAWDSLAATLAGATRRTVGELSSLAVLARAGLVAPIRPDRLALMGLSALRWGATLGTLIAAGADRYRDAAAIVDEFGALTYAELNAQVDAAAVGLHHLGVSDGDSIALLARNHRGFIVAAAAAAKAGCDLILLNTGFSGPQIGQVCNDHHIEGIIADREFEDLVTEAATGRVLVVTAPDEPLTAPGRNDAVTLEWLVASNRHRQPVRPGHQGGIVILTSGTTGAPKGARRSAVGGHGGLSLEAPAALLERIPMRRGDRIALAAPTFHSWGFANLLLGLSLGATLYLRARFEAEAWLEAMASDDIDVLIAVPVMLQRILTLDGSIITAHRPTKLRVTSLSGSALPGELATTWMDTFGENLYNLYGSTEVAYATIAGPDDLRAAPGTAGRPTRGTTVALLDDDGNQVADGDVGRIFVGNSQVFGGYTGGGDKEHVHGLTSTGDVGRFDASGRLFVEGRDDDMIVSGGENVFPREVEDLLSGHPGIDDASCVGVDDPDLGQRLIAFVVVNSAGTAPNADDLKAYVKENLARFKVPRDVVFVDELPRNATGKILKRSLLATYSPNS